MRRRGFLIAAALVLVVGLVLSIAVMDPATCQMDEECSPNQGRVAVALGSLLIAGILASLSFPGRASLDEGE